MPDLPPSTSASQLVSYAMCPRKYALQYVWGVEPEFRSTSLIVGSAVHGAIGWYFEERLAGRKPSHDAAVEVLKADLMAGAVGGVPVRWKDATPESLEADSVRYLRTYLSRFGDLGVASVERPFKVDLVDPGTGEVIGRPVKGYFDLVLTSGRVVEVKTSARGWNVADLVRHLQVGAYAYACVSDGEQRSKLDVHVIVKLKKEPRVETYEVERGERDVRWWIQAAAATERAIQAGHFPPKPSSLCMECEYGRTCANWVDELPPTSSVVRRLPVAQDDRFAAVADL